jgi:Flagellar hook-length control protein
VAGINVLSDSLKGGNKLEKTSAQKGKDVEDSPGNAADIFAAILSGSMNFNVQPKGQDSSIAGPDMEGTQSAGDSQQQPQKSGPQGNSPMGYGKFAIPFLTQFMLQRGIPAGKEANSGNVVDQGTGLLTTNSQLTNAIVGFADKSSSLANSGVVNFGEVPQASDESLGATGMVAPNSQGGNPAITELDKYRQVIAGLLEALSGEISSPQGNLLKLGNGTKTFNQDANVMKLFQGEGSSLISQMLSQEENKEPQTGSVPDFSALMAKVMNLVNSLSSEIAPETHGQDATKKSSLGDSPISQMLSQEGNKELHTGSVPDFSALMAKVVTLVNSLSTEIAPETLDQDATQKLSLGDSLTSQTLSLEGGKQIQAEGKVISESAKPAMSLSQQENSLSSESAGVKMVRDDSVPPVQKNTESSIKQLKENVTGQAAIKAKDFELSTRQRPEKMDSQSVSAEPKAVSDEQKQNAAAAAGIVGNTILSNVTSGKTAALPVWEQISAAFHSQIMNRNQELKELDIQLHPAELGKVHINLRWENGMVHLQVQASEASTGQVLQNHLTELRQNLTEQGVSCGTLQMGQGGHQQPSGQGDESRKTFTHYKESSVDDEPIPSNETIFGGKDEVSRINVTA